MPNNVKTSKHHRLFLFSIQPNNFSEMLLEVKESSQYFLCHFFLQGITAMQNIET